MVREDTRNTTAESSTALRLTRTRRRWFRCLLLVFSVLSVVATFVLIGTFIWPTELEQEIRLDLITKDAIDENTRVSVVSELKLFSFYSRFGPQRFATLCLQNSDGSLQLAYARCWREGMLWRTDSSRWRTMTSWPSVDEIRQFELDHADVVESVMKSGYLPRPPGTEGFQLTHALIEVSEDVHGFEANRDVDPIALAGVLSNGIVPGSFSLARFHEPRWHSPRKGIEAIEKSIEFLHIILDKRECEAIDCVSFLEVLNATKETLLRAEELNLKFHFLGTDRSGE